MKNRRAVQKDRTDRFEPLPGLKNGHLQTLINSSKIRRLLSRQRARGMLAAAAPHILDCGGGVRLMGYYSGRPQSTPPDLCILIHGWEGDAESSYIVSAAGRLWNRGYAIFRLNLRDHGPSHHLNKGLFHGCRLDETIGAVRAIQKNFPFRRLFLAGFSLGGNFALRIGANAHKAGLQLERIAAVCPVLDPVKTVDAIEPGRHNDPRLSLYHWYFLRKWRRSLTIKSRLFPGMIDLDAALQYPSIRSLTEYFVPRYTDFACADDYLAGYAVTGSRLAGLTIPATIIASMDDPVIPAEDLARLARPASLCIEKQDYGGHCGFIPDFRLGSWINKRLEALFQTGENSHGGPDG